MGREADASLAGELALSRAVKLKERRLELAALLHLADSYKSSGQFSRALNCLDRADKLIGLVPAGKDRAIYKIQSGLARGNALGRMGRCHDSLESHRQSLKLCLAAYRERNDSTASVMGNVGLACRHTRDLQGALVHVRRSAAIFAQLGRGDFLDAANATINLGEILAQQGKFEEALKLFSRALPLLRKQLPAEHSSIAILLRDLSDVNTQLGRGADAQAWAAQAIVVQRRSQSNCAAAGCVRRQREDGAPLDQCAGCLRTYYCSVACQTADWKAGHKKECKALQRKGAGVGRDER